MTFVKNALVSVLSLQMVLLPAAIAQQPIKAPVVRDLNDAQRVVSRAAERLEGKGFELLASDGKGGRKPVKAQDLFTSLVKGEKPHFFGVTPYIPEIRGKYGMEIRLVEATQTKMSYVFAFYDSSFKTRIDSRLIEIDSEKDADMTAFQVRQEQLVSAMVTSLAKKQDLLAAAKAPSLFERLIPSANAQTQEPPRKYSNSLKEVLAVPAGLFLSIGTIAIWIGGFAIIFGVMSIAFGEGPTWNDKKLGVKGSLAFVLGYLGFCAAYAGISWAYSD